MRAVLLVVALLCVSLPHVAAVANSLSDCQTFAALFNNTCASGPVSDIVASSSNINVVCTSGMNTAAKCPGTLSNGVCSFYHKLCVTCSVSNGVTRIRVQTNGMPPRCPNVVDTQPLYESNTDFEVNFNPDVRVNTTSQLRYNSVSSNAALSSVLCSVSVQGNQNVPAGAAFVQNGISMQTTSGVALDGVVLLNPNNAQSQDPYFPAQGASVLSTFDECLGHTDPQGHYHYHSMSKCMKVFPTGTSIQACSAVTGCSTSAADFNNYELAGFANYQTLTPVGILKDGHIMYGPYDSAGAVISTGFDMCNGMFLNAGGDYGYISTSRYPYISACWGPATYPCFFQPTCTQNALQAAYLPSTFSGLAQQCGVTGAAAPSAGMASLVGVAIAMATAVMMML